MNAPSTEKKEAACEKWRALADPNVIDKCNACPHPSGPLDRKTIERIFREEGVDLVADPAEAS